MTLHDHAAKYRDMAPHVETLTALAAEARHVIELGVRTGVSTWALLDGLPPDGTLTSVDMDEVDVPDRVSGDPRWTFIHGHDLEVPLEWLGAPDLVFIDTSHLRYQTLAELFLAHDLGARVIALHDYALEDVEAAAADFRRTEPGWALEVEPSEWGLAVLRR